MGCEYKIYGSVTLQRSQEVEVLLEALRERLDDAVEVEELDENTIELTLNFDDSTTVHTPSAMDDLFQQMEPFVIGAGRFDIETSGANWTEYLGTPEEVTKLRSASALRLIEEHIDLLTAADRTKLGAAGEMLALRNALGALMGNIPPPSPAELKKAGLGSLAYNWRRAKTLLKEVPIPEPATNEFIVLHKLQVVLQEELDALRTWRTAQAMGDAIGWIITGLFGLLGSFILFTVICFVIAIASGPASPTTAAGMSAQPQITESGPSTSPIPQHPSISLSAPEPQSTPVSQPAAQPQSSPAIETTNLETESQQTMQSPPQSESVPNSVGASALSFHWVCIEGQLMCGYRDPDNNLVEDWVVEHGRSFPIHRMTIAKAEWVHRLPGRWGCEPSPYGMYCFERNEDVVIQQFVYDGSTIYLGVGSGEAKGDSRYSQN